jgi:hypothetical protein
MRSVVVAVFILLSLISSGDSIQEPVYDKVGDRATESFAGIFV